MVSSEFMRYKNNPKNRESWATKIQHIRALRTRLGFKRRACPPTLPQFRLGAWRLRMQMNAWELKSMPGSSHRRLGAQFDAWELKSMPGRSNRRLRAQIDAWEVKSTLGNSNRRLGAQINTWEVKSTPQNLHTGGEKNCFLASL